MLLKVAYFATKTPSPSAPISASMLPSCTSTRRFEALTWNRARRCEF